MIDAVITSSLIVGGAALCSAIFRRQSAAVRHMIWTAALVFALVAPLSTPLLPSWELGPVPIAAVIDEQPQFTSQTSDVAVPSASQTLNLSVADLMFCVWLAGIGLGILWLLVGAARLGWLAFHARPVRGGKWALLLDEVSLELHLRRSVRLLRTDRAALMGAWGIFSGRVLLPPDAETWPDERIRVVLI